MPPRGRKPKPTHLKVVTGNPGKRQLNEHEPKPVPEIPAPPPHLCDEAKVEWGRVCDQLYRLKLLSEIDRTSLAGYCQAYGRWVQAERALARMAESDGVTKGLLVKTRNGNAIQNPLVGTANKAMADMMRYAAEFGMTPSARSRLSTDGEDQDDPARKYFA